jgi:hypothetical protein
MRYIDTVLSLYITITDFRLSQRLIIDVNSVLGLLHRVDVGDITDVSKVHAASIISVEYPVS